MKFVKIVPGDFNPKSALDGFLEFVRSQGVIGLAVGFILGAAVAKFVAALVADIVSPIIGLLLGSAEGLDHMALGPFKIGHLLSTAIDSLAVAAVVYVFVIGLGLDKLDRKGEKTEHGAEAIKEELKEAMKKGGEKKE